MKMKMKDLVMLGIISGIAFFFIGAIISTVFPSSQTDLMSYKVASSIKLIGIGALTSSMIIGGITIETIDKNLRLLLLLLGLVLLIIYTVGSQSLQWYVPTSSQTPSGNQSYDYRPTGYGVPGFELISLIGAVMIVLFLVRKRCSR
jgi:MFS family permease